MSPGVSPIAKFLFFTFILYTHKLFVQVKYHTDTGVVVSQNITPMLG